VLYSESGVAGRAWLTESQWANVDFLDRVLRASITPFVQYSPVPILKKPYYFKYKVHT
jgi:hypothetical protein